MSRDILREATRALRDERDVEPAIASRRADVTRDRIVASLAQERRRLPRGMFLVPLAAILIGSTAWASGMLPAAWHALTSSDEPAERSQPVVLVAPSTAPVPVTPVVPVVEHDETAAPEPDVKEDVARPVASARGEQANPSATPDPAAALYRAAHEAHFSQNNPSLALARWNAYLAKAPSGRFAPEAAYNRALCLVRLGQHDAAKTALAPFASGSYGGYRQAEAQKLVDALSGKPSQRK